jgi:3-oxoacyl-[acyl-carrier protein] reductase
LALELRARGVAVNVVAPGLVDTARLAANLGGAEAAAKQPQPLASAADVARAIADACGLDESVTGQIFTADGGLGAAMGLPPFENFPL